MSEQLSYPELLQLKRWNTPTIYNGWEQITESDHSRVGVNREETRDFMPDMGPMVGYAVTLVIQPGEKKHQSANPDAWSQYREYIGSIAGPKIVVVQDLDKPETYGSAWGEVNANIHRALGCVGIIVDGAIRDLEEMHNAGLKALARRLCVGHAYATPVSWGEEVSVFGTTVKPGQLVHADKHGFLAIPEADEKRLLEAATFMDTNECNHLISVARSSSGLTTREILDKMNVGATEFGVAARKKFGRSGEW